MHNNLKQLIKIIQVHLNTNFVRSEFIAFFLTSLIKAKSVNLSDVATLFKITNKFDSNYRRIQRFFKEYMMNFELIGKMLISLLPGGRKFIVVIDRTNWEFGKTAINIMMISVVYKNISFPVCWKLLNKKGFSNYKERIELLDKLLEILPKERIESIVCDREFDGIEFIGYLKEKDINFHIRIRHTITYNGHKEQKGKRIKNLLDKVKSYNYFIHPKKVVMYEQMLHVGGKRLPDGDYLILISLRNPEEALQSYKQRWSIEKLFNKLKRRGFNLEATHMTDTQKLEKLLALVSIAYLWAFLTGEEVKKSYSVKMYETGKRVKSSFDLGIKYLRRTMFYINDMVNEFFNLINLLSCA
jgi:hypothetical protein